MAIRMRTLCHDLRLPAHGTRPVIYGARACRLADTVADFALCDDKEPQMRQASITCTDDPQPFAILRRARNLPQVDSRGAGVTTESVERLERTVRSQSSANSRSTSSPGE